jgi:hypothetical protein
MTTFFERQEDRDRLARHDMAVGDECRRWSTCDRCGTQSPELVVMQEQDAWEDEHAGPFGDCTAPAPERLYDEVMERWPYPEMRTFTRRYEPAGDLVPAAPRYDPVPFTPRPNKGVIYADSRPMDEERGAA